MPETLTMEGHVASSTSMARRATIASTLGAALEWIDFTAYGAVAATVFPKLFFTSMDPNMGILAAFVTFGVGFFARPLGGLFFGMLGDRIGRKNILLYTLSLMGLASFLIGCLPSYSTIGFAAPLFLVALRFLQGFALGGEATGAQLMTMEHAPQNRRGLYGSFINVGSSLSAALASAMLFGLTSALGQEQFQVWGWRVPFLLSFILVIVGVYIRLRVSETPAFKQAHEAGTEARVPLIEAFRQYPGTILRLLIIWCAPTACFYVITVFTLSYLTKNLGLHSQTAFLCLMAANVLAVLTMVGGGALSDKIGRKPTMLIASVLTLIVALSYFALLDTKNWLLIFVAMAAFVGSLQIQSGVQPAFFAEPFPTRVRYSGSAAAYAGANLLMGGPTPFIAAWLLQRSGGQTWVITAFCVVVIGASLIAIIASPETRNLDIKR
ncbi:MFS transporter [Burkholderia multivorans]|uniref:MFS transporter n=1 Tax=Burkholderia multivorans TaxID=87883 RepID=UPI001FCA4016|nr:MFS transporter [Burkholderia multivorans]